jgi:hypothetical protein
LGSEEVIIKRKLNLNMSLIKIILRQNLIQVLPFILLSVFISCRQKENQEDIFKNIPIEYTKNYIDSIAHKIKMDAGANFTARPTLKRNEYYYDERNFRDTIGNLKEYSIMESLGDTSDNFTNYYFCKNQLILVLQVHYFFYEKKPVYVYSKYYFRENKLYNDTVQLPLPVISADTLLNKGSKYLSYKGDVGDKGFRKYFGKKSHPPNSNLLLVQ